MDNIKHTTLEAIKKSKKKSLISGTSAVVFVTIFIFSVLGYSGEMEMWGTEGDHVDCPNGACAFPLTIKNGFNATVTVHQSNIKADGNPQIISSFTAKKKIIAVQENYTIGIDKEYLCKNKVAKNINEKGNTTYSCSDAPDELKESKSVLYNEDTKKFFYVVHQETSRTIEKDTVDTSDLILLSGETTETTVFFRVPVGSSGKFNITLYVTIDGVDYTFVLDPYWTASGYIWKRNIINSTVGVALLINGSGTYSGSDINGSGTTEWIYSYICGVLPAIYSNSSSIFTILSNGTIQCNYGRTYPLFPRTSDVGTATSWWKLDDTSGDAIDSGSAGNDGTLVGGPTQTETGQINESYDFNGAGDYVNTGTTFSLTDGDVQAVSLWFNADDTDSCDSLFGDYDRNAITGTMLAFTADSKMQVTTISVSNSKRKNSDSAITIGKWYHAYYEVVANGDVKFYLNGVEQTDGSASSGTLAASQFSTRNFIVGAQAYCGGVGTERYFNGHLDDIKVWTVVRSADEIQQIYMEGLGIYYDSSTTTDLQLHMPFDNSFSSALDISGNDNNGVLINTPTQNVTGKINKAYTFASASSEYANLGDVDAFEFGDTDDFTISLWLKTSTSSTMYIFATGDGGAGEGWWTLGLDTGGTYFQIDDGSDSVGDTGDSVSDGDWHNVIVVVDRTADYFYTYIDGVLNATSASIASVGSTANADDDMIGRRTTTYYNGELDELQIYNRSLNTTEIEAVFRQGAYLSVAEQDMACPTLIWSNNITIQHDLQFQGDYSLSDLHFFGMVSDDTTSWRCRASDLGELVCKEVI